MTRAPAIALLLLGCASTVEPPRGAELRNSAPRWQAPAVPVCSDADLEQPTLAAIDAWAGVGPELVHCGPCSSACVGDPGAGPDVDVGQRGIAVAGRSSWACDGGDLGATARRPAGDALEAASVWLCWNASARGYDLQAVITHELGHALGIATHAQNANAVMAEQLAAGRRERELTAEDRALAAELYP